MNTNIFLAGRLASKADKSGKLSNTSRVISVVSVAISICVIIIAIAVANGFRFQIAEKARGFAADIVLTTPGEDIINTVNPINADLSYKSKIEELSFVENVFPVSYKQGILKTDNQISGLVIKGVDSTYNTDFYKNHLVEGRVPAFGGKRASEEIIISKRLADMMQYNVGDKVTAYFIGDEVKVRRFTLVGTFDAQLEQVDKYFALADIRHINILNKWNNRVSGFEVFFKDNDVTMARDEDELNSRVDQINDIMYSFSTENDLSVSITTLHRRFYVLRDWLHLLDLNVLIILTLMIVVAGFNMVSGLLILLFERVQHIGLLKALGMTNRQVAQIFLLQGAFIVIKGMVWGNGVALLFCLLEAKYNFIPLSPDNYFVSSVPISIGVVEVFAVNILAFALITLLLVLPCYFISKISPAKTMRAK